VFGFLYIKISHDQISFVRFGLKVLDTVNAVVERGGRAPHDLEESQTVQGRTKYECKVCKGSWDTEPVDAESLKITLDAQTCDNQLKKLMQDKLHIALSKATPKFKAVVKGGANMKDWSTLDWNEESTYPTLEQWYDNSKSLRTFAQRSDLEAQPEGPAQNPQEEQPVSVADVKSSSQVKPGKKKR
jgi:hypothetical protein